jgi:hypothetical protein
MQAIQILLEKESQHREALVLLAREIVSDELGVPKAILDNISYSL